MYPLRRTCKEVAALVVAREDRALPLAERLALRMHMRICAACPKFERQIFLMRTVMRQWRAYGDGGNYGGNDRVNDSAEDKSASGLRPS